MKIAIVNDQPATVEALRRIVGGVPGYSIAWVAGNGPIAVEKCAADKPDLILMGVQLPVMDGVEATRRIMAATPCPILIVTSSVDKHYAQVFDAMGHGALDAVNTPEPGGGAPLLQKILMIQNLRAPYQPAPGHTTASAGQFIPDLPPLLLVGASTGGPQAVSAVLSLLPANFDLAVVIIQHLGSEFADGLRAWLGDRSALPVVLAAEGATPRAGTVYVACTNHHLVLQPKQTFHYTPQPEDCPYRPSVDAFFRSAGCRWPRKGIAVLLTGMGRDGAQGLLELRQAGWHTVTQNEATCVVFGMPKAAAELKAASEVLPLDCIGAACLKYWKTQLRGQGARKKNA